MRILATTDGSRRSLRALAHAGHFASAAGAELILLRVLDPRADAHDEQALSLDEAVDRVAERWTGELARTGARAGIAVTPLVEVKERREDVAETVLRVADRYRVRAIAMASRGAGVLHAAVLGSVASNVLKQSPVPVLMVGQKARAPQDGLPYHIVLTTDGSPAASAALPAARRALADATAEHFRMTLLRIHQPTVGDPYDALDEAARELQDFRRRAPRRFPVATELRESLQLRGLHGAILRAADDLHATALWMTTQGYSLRRRVLLGSVALSALGEATVPIFLTSAATAPELKH